MEITDVNGVLALLGREMCLIVRKNGPAAFVFRFAADRGSDLANPHHLREDEVYSAPHYGTARLESASC